MANEEHLAILKQGADAWNAWRQENRDVYPNLRVADLSGINLRKADLSGSDLRGADLSRTNISKAYFREANLRGANFTGSNLHRVDLNGANLSGVDLIGVDLGGAELHEADLCWAKLAEANLKDADLRGAHLRGANLFRCNLQKTDLGQVNLSDAELSAADLKGARFSQTILGNIDFSETKGLEEVIHSGPSSIGFDTIQKSRGKVSEVFLRGCGLSDVEIEFTKLAAQGLDSEQAISIAYEIANLYSGRGIHYYSCFISYNNEDEAFARKLHDNLQENSVRCWYAPEDMKIGDRIRPKIDQEISLRDKLLVILSENSINSEWVGDEVEAALEEEKVSGRTILFPIRLDDAVMETRQDWAAKIKRRRHIGDFTDWKNKAKYQISFGRLLRDLKATG